jgi:hypothetical protein
MTIDMTVQSLIKPYDFKDITIISGGQTGADQGGLEGAAMAGFLTGGFMPKGFKTEYGSMPELADKYRLIEATSPDYIYRTHLNAKHSSITLWFGSDDSVGYNATSKACKSYSRPFYNVTNCTADDIVLLIRRHQPTIINIAGNRESKAKGMQEKVKNIIYNVLNKLK